MWPGYKTEKKHGFRKKEANVAEHAYRYGQVTWFWYTIARLYCRLFGWKVTGQENLPDDPRMIGIIAPHTSNWDVWMMYVMADHMRIKANWLAKDSLFKWYSGWFYKMMGGIPVKRDKRMNMVDQTAEIIRKYPRIYLAVAPEGTRSYTDHWKTGFYYIALKAGVKIICMFIDYKKREVGFGPVIEPSGDIHADFEIIRDFYSGVTGLYPENTNAMVIRPREAQADTGKAAGDTGNEA
jgi:1-acyl-sn-glycerol-3-phosphate acyltransferase